VAHVLQFLLSGGGAISCLSLLTLWVVLSRGSAPARRALAVGAVAYWTAGAYLVPQTVTRLLAAPYTPLTADRVPPGRTAIVLLGSSAYQVGDWSGKHFSTLDRISASRLLEAARVYHLIHADYVISSGGLDNPTDWARPAGPAMADALVTLGVPRNRILMEDRSTTTHDEAVIVGAMLASRPVDHVILVTSQFHMRRSAGTFRAAGIDVIPAIAYFEPRIDRWWGKLVPTDKGLEETALVAHEIVGIADYTRRGWYTRTVK
jgi:uncharacterized SAM-binding protein YcdF (DUF218 family)